MEKGGGGLLHRNESIKTTLSQRVHSNRKKLSGHLRANRNIHLIRWAAPAMSKCSSAWHLPRPLQALFGQARQCQCRLASGRCGMSPRAAIHAERLQGMQHHSPGFRQSPDFSGRELTDQKPMRESLRLSIHQAQAHAQLRC